jgi:hypothetical protein
LHHPDCDCPTCECEGLGVFAYCAVADELGSDDPGVLDPAWRARCQARLEGLRQRTESPSALMLSHPSERCHVAA